MHTKSMNKLESDQRYSQSDVKVISCETLYKGFFRCNKYRLQHKLFSGEWSPEIEREFFERGDAAAILPYDIKNDSIVLVEQFRFGAMGTAQSPWLFELIAGMIEKGEFAEEVVKREATEEAGLHIESAEFMLQCLVSPGGTTEKIDLFLAEIDTTNVSGIHGLESEGEDIKVHVIPRKTAYKWVCDGKINNATTIIALQWLELNLKTVRSNHKTPDI